MKNLYLTLVFLFSLTAQSQAQTTNKIFVDRAANTIISTVNTGDILQIRVSPGSCYCCDIVDENFNVAFASATVNISSSAGASTITGSLRGLTDSKIKSFNQRNCFTTPTTLTGSSITASMTLNTLSTTNNIAVSCSETTLYGGFNTSVTDFNFLEISNTLDNTTQLSDQTVSGKITATNTVPEPDTTVINQFPFTVSAGSRVDIDIHSKTGTGAFGPVKICHDGPPGSLKAVMSQYNTKSTTPFKIEPVAQEQFLPHSALAGGIR